jgi:EmrB/QacA subfamily drug resistance transporter
MTPSMASSNARWVLLCAILSSSMAFIDATALSVVMPALQREMSAAGTDLLWINNGYALPLASLLLLGGALGDYYGRKRILGIGILIFAAASLACGLAAQIPLLIAARVCQGAGAALIIPNSLAMLATYFEESGRGGAIGKWSAGSVIASALGPVLGGLLAGIGHWRWIFFINLPLAAVALTLMQLRVPRLMQAAPSGPPDYRGALWGTSGLVAINFGLIRCAHPTPGGLVVPAALIGGVIALCFFAWVELRGKNPLLPLRLFKSPALSAASIVTLLCYTALNGMLFFLPLNLIQVQGYDSLRAGLTQLPMMIMLIALSPWAGALVDRNGPRLPLTIGPFVAGAGFLLLAYPGMGHGPAEFWASYFPGLVLLGAGFGLTAAPLSATVIGAVPNDRVGAASGINSTLARLSAVLAMATLGPIFMGTFQHSLQDRMSRMEFPAEVAERATTDTYRLLEAPMPPDWDAAIVSQLSSEKKQAFIDAFRMLAFLSGGLAWVGALVAAFKVRPVIPTEKGIPSPQPPC